MKYYIAVESGCQWETCLFRVGGDEVCHEKIDVPSDIKGSFLDNIFGRELHFTNKVFAGETKSWYGWTISEYEYTRLYRILKLYPSYKEYLKVIELEKLGE